MGSFRQYLEGVQRQGQVKIMYFNSEDNWELGAVVEKIAGSVGINVLSNKEVSLIAYVDRGQGGEYEYEDEGNGIQPEDVVGGVVDCRYADNDGDTYDFDVVVRPEWQGPQMIGFRLIDEAIKKASYEDCNTIRTHFINKRLAPIMISKYGFEIERTEPNGTVHLIRRL